ncbi:MAG: hypothetical protein FK733_04925 [Asgard group archaeon]|nr:hypothetical protein [Asgard group archaeon]
MLFNNKKRILRNVFLVFSIFVAQFLGPTVQQGSASTIYLDDISEEKIIAQIKSATTELTSIFNDDIGIFVWNIQDPLNISKYGDLTDESNFDEVSDHHHNIEDWFSGLTQDILMQYSFLKNKVTPALSHVAEEEIFVREWIFLTEEIVEWIYSVVTNDQLIDLLNFLSDSGDGFGEFWNTLIRPKHYEFLNERVALIPETLALGSKILKSVEFIPYFSFIEQYSILLRADVVSQWWNNINQYAMFDPMFAVGGIGNSYIYNYHHEWIGWDDFTRMIRNQTFSSVDVFQDEYLPFQDYLYTSPQIAYEYLTYINKLSCGSSIIWNKYSYQVFPITDSTLYMVHYKLVYDYASHITWIDDQIQYIFDPRVSEINWIPLANHYSGYSYVWAKYFVVSQGSNYDYYQYINDQPLSITNSRSFQGAGDIRGLIDVYRVLRYGFEYDELIQYCEEKALQLLEQILNSARNDGGFMFSPYFGTAVDEFILPVTLINDAELIQSLLLPKGMNYFTGTLTTMDFLLEAQDDLEKIGSYPFAYKNKEFESLKSYLANSLRASGNLLLANINSKTFGIPKQAIVSSKLLYDSIDPPYFTARSVKVYIELESSYIPIGEMPNWVIQFDYFNKIGRSIIYQWDYLEYLKDLYLITKEFEFVVPIFDSLNRFDQDYNDDNQYQLSTICEGKDPVARTFFDEKYIGTSIELNDNSGFFSDFIPFDYRIEVFPISSAFATETPIKISELVLTVLPVVLNPLINTPILNKIILLGFISGVMMTIVIIYVKRPQNH